MLSDDFVDIAIKTSLEMTELAFTVYGKHCLSSEDIAYAKNVEVARYIIEEKGVKVDNITIHTAIIMKREDLLPYLLSKTDISNIYRGLTIALIHCKNLELSFIIFLVKLGALYSPVDGEIAAVKGYLDIVTYFHQAGNVISNTTRSDYGSVRVYLHKHRIGIYIYYNVF